MPFRRKPNPDCVLCGKPIRGYRPTGDDRYWNKKRHHTRVLAEPFISNIGCPLVLIKGYVHKECKSEFNYNKGMFIYYELSNIIYS